MPDVTINLWTLILARDAAQGYANGERVFYLKVGRGQQIDLEITAAVRRSANNAVFMIA